MSEAIDPVVRVRRRRRRRRSSEPAVNIPRTPLERSLLWLGAGLLALSTLLLFCLFNPSAAGVGTIRPAFSVVDGKLSVSNVDACSWSGVSVHGAGFNGEFGEALPEIQQGSSRTIGAKGNGPFLVAVRCDRAGVTEGGYWFGIAY